MEPPCLIMSLLCKFVHAGFTKRIRRFTFRVSRCFARYRTFFWYSTLVTRNLKRLETSLLEHFHIFGVGYFFAVMAL